VNWTRAAGIGIDEEGEHMTALGGRPLRSPDELREKGCSEAAVHLITALHELLAEQFGRSGQYLALAQASGVPEGERRRYSKNLSERMGGRRAAKGPTWEIVRTILELCVAEERRLAETQRLAELWELAWGQAPPGPRHAGLLGQWRAVPPSVGDFCHN
jgi:hypothetical protein